MLFVVHALDRPNGLDNRMKNYRDHRAHLDRAEAEGIEIVTAGPLVADDGETPIGSLFVCKANDRTTVEAFCNADPYKANGVWETIQVHAYVNRRGWASHGSAGL
jgi:uncharacterized protein YciI